MNRWSGALGALLCACALMTPGAARAEGPGIKLGDRLLLHLGISAEFRYDDNVFFESGKAGAKTGAFIFSLAPSVDLSTRESRGGGGGNVDFRLHAGLTYNEYLTNRDTLAGHHDIGVDLSTALTLFPRGRFGVTLFENFVRTTQPPYTNEPYNIDRDDNQLGLRLRGTPGGGRLVIDFSFMWGVDYFEKIQFQDLDLFSYNLDLRFSWKFFPKTALYLEANEVINRYLYQNGDFPHPDSYPLHIDLGVIGLLTTKLSVNAFVGYGNGFYASQKIVTTGTKTAPSSNPNTAFGGVSLGWKPTIFSTGSIGYKYDFSNSLLGAYYNGHQVYVAWTQLVWRFAASARLQYSYLTYEDILPSQRGNTTNASLTRTDNLLQFDLRVDYPFKPWLIASVGYDLQFDNSSAEFQIPATNALVPADYLTNEVWLRLSVLY